MCDYSLAVLPNRLAVEGEELVVHRFRTGSIGLAPPAELQTFGRRLEAACRRSFWKRLKTAFEGSPNCADITAVCVPPGAQLLISNIPEDLQRQWRIQDEETVLFVEISAAENIYRDAVQFRHGRVVMLQSLREGLPVQVVSLGAIEVREEQSLMA